MSCSHSGHDLVYNTDMENTVVGSFTEGLEQHASNTKAKKLYPSMTVEHCLPLSIGAIGRNLLHLAKDGDKKGTVYLANNYSSLMIGYHLITSNPPRLQIWFPYKGEARIQTIPIFTLKVGFGNKPFLFCRMCGTLRSKLYLRHDRAVNYFSCRQCLELRYEIQNINRRGGILAEMSYRINRAQRVDRYWKGFKRKIYAGKITKPFLRWAIAVQKWLGPQVAAIKP